MQINKNRNDDFDRDYAGSADFSFAHSSETSIDLKFRRFLGGQLETVLKINKIGTVLRVAIDDTDDSTDYELSASCDISVDKAMK